MKNEPVRFRLAAVADLESIVALLRDDVFGQGRNPEYASERGRYDVAFSDILRDPNNGIVVMEQAGRIIGVAQLTFIRGLSHIGGTRAQVESVRVASNLRGQGLGMALMEETIRLARERGCFVLQLTTDVRRGDTKSFYEKLGFSASHYGMKLWL